MKWTEVKVQTESEAVEAISNIFMEAGASGVAIEDALDVENFQSDAFGEILDKKTFSHIKEGAEVLAYFPETTFLPEVLPFIKDNIKKLPEYGLNIGKNKMQITEVAEKDWAFAWKKYYHPIRVSRFLTIVPNWEEYYPVSTDERILKLDPGMAFGTGTHPTTKLTLQGMESYMRGGETILDVGTGSGVLSIAAKALGAKNVWAYDLDHVAVNVAKENIQLNDYAQDVNVQANDLLKGIAMQADLIVANILADIILLLISDAWNNLKEEGYFIVSGIIQDKKASVKTAAEEQGFILEEERQQKDWVCMVFQRPSSES